MKPRHFSAICLLALCLLASCSERHKAITLAEDFIEAHATAPQEMTHRNFGKLRTTNRLNDSIVSSLRERPTPFYRPDIVYPPYAPGDTLYYILMHFVCQNETINHTFYIDHQLQHVVAVK